MDIPIGVNVICGTESCGKSTYLVINPVNDQVTHLVVAEKASPYLERLVPVGTIAKTSPDSIHLRCSLQEFSNMNPFMETDFIGSGEVKAVVYTHEPYYMWPYGLYEYVPMPLEYRNIPAGEVVIRRGSQVKATDGNVGRVDEFLVDADNNCITHLVMREGHLWGAKDITIPVTEIESIEDEAVILKIDKDAVGRLPTIPVSRKWL